MGNLEQHLDHIRTSIPNLTISTVRVISDGLVNDVVIVNNEVIFRFPKNARAKQSLTQETRILDLTRGYVEMRIPLFEHREEDFVAYQLIPGDSLSRNDILDQDEAIQNRLAEQLATFLRQLHAIPSHALRRYRISQSDAVRKQSDWLCQYQDVERELFPLLMTDVKDWVRRHFAAVLDGRASMSYKPVLIHGDLASSHILYDRTQHRITGVIDFGTAGVGDPASDFALIISMFGESFLRRMARFYPEIGNAVNRARFRAGALELEWALAGLRSNDVSWLLCHIGRARDVMPIGSRWT